MSNIKGTYGRFACIPDEMGGLLLVQRGWYLKDGEKKWDGRWNYPGGGVDEKDAEVMHCAEEIVAREVLEETGLLVIFANHRPVGEYPTAKHTDVAITYLCMVVDGQPEATEEGVAFKYVTPAEAMEMAKRGDVPDGLVGGLKTSTGGVPRHIQMVLHYFTRVCKNKTYRRDAKQYCKELGIPI